MNTRLKWLLTVGAVFDGNPAFFIDEHAQRALRSQLEIDQFVAQTRQVFRELFEYPWISRST